MRRTEPEARVLITSENNVKHPRHLDLTSTSGNPGRCAHEAFRGASASLFRAAESGRLGLSAFLRADSAGAFRSLRRRSDKGLA